MKIANNEIKINHIWQTDIDDKAAAELCMWECEIFMGWSYGRKSIKNLPCPDLKFLNWANDEAIKRGGLKKATDGDSVHGYVTNHEINFQIGGGPKGYTKEYEYFKDAGFEKIVNLIQWGALVELRDEGRHSMIANGSYLEDGKPFLSVIDPWPKSNDQRMDCTRFMTQKMINGKWVDSRSIECFAWYHKDGSNPKWV